MAACPLHLPTSPAAHCIATACILLYDTACPICTALIRCRAQDFRLPIAVSYGGLMLVISVRASLDMSSAQPVGAGARLAADSEHCLQQRPAVCQAVAAAAVEGHLHGPPHWREHPHEAVLMSLHDIPVLLRLLQQELVHLYCHQGVLLVSHKVQEL